MQDADNSIFAERAHRPVHTISALHIGTDLATASRSETFSLDAADITGNV